MKKEFKVIPKKKRLRAYVNSFIEISYRINEVHGLCFKLPHQADINIEWKNDRPDYKSTGIKFPEFGFMFDSDKDNIHNDLTLLLKRKNDIRLTILAFCIIFAEEIKLRKRKKKW